LKGLSTHFLVDACRPQSVAITKAGDTERKGYLDEDYEVDVCCACFRFEILELYRIFLRQVYRGWSYFSFTYFFFVCFVIFPIFYAPTTPKLACLVLSLTTTGFLLQSAPNICDMWASELKRCQISQQLGRRQILTRTLIATYAFIMILNVPRTLIISIFIFFLLDFRISFFSQYIFFSFSSNILLEFFISSFILIIYIATKSRSQTTSIFNYSLITAFTQSGALLSWTEIKWPGFEFMKFLNPMWWHFQCVMPILFELHRTQPFPCEKEDSCKTGDIALREIGWHNGECVGSISIFGVGSLLFLCISGWIMLKKKIIYSEDPLTPTKLTYKFKGRAKRVKEVEDFAPKQVSGVQLPKLYE